MKIINITKKTVLAEDVFMADAIFTRMRGLLGRKEFKLGEAIILKPCNSIHTFFMRFAIDVLFMNKENKVIKVCKNVTPYRITPIYLNSAFAIELPVGAINYSNTSESDSLSILP